MNRLNKRIFFLGISSILFFATFWLHLDVTKYEIQTISLFGVGIISFIYVSWSCLYYRVLSPYIVYVTCLYLCLCGQSIMWAFGLEAGWRDLRLNTYWNFNNRKLSEALLYSYLCILMLHITVISNIGKSRHFKPLKIFSKFRGVPLSKHLNKIGWFFVAISAGPYLYMSIMQFSTIATLGYDAQYTVQVASSGLTQFSEYISVGLLILMYSVITKASCFSKYLVYTISCIYLFIEFQLGQRTPLILFALAVLFIVYKNKTINSKLVLLGFLGIFVGMTTMRLIVLFREGTILNMNDMAKFLENTDNIPAVDFLGDIGWNIFSLGYCQQLLPYRFEYGYGISYLMSLTCLIPNIGFWDIHPAAEYGMLGNWLQKTLEMSFGPGFTPVAESYYNFGWLGSFVFILWGKFCIYMNRLYEDKNNSVSYLFFVLIVGVVFKSAVRSAFLAFFKPLIFMCVIPILLISYLSNSNRKI